MDPGLKMWYCLVMGIAERKDRQRQELHRTILDTALDLARESSWKDVSIRKVVERMEYAPSVVYQHFDNKDSLLRELREEGFEKLRLLLSEVPALPPRERLKAMAVRFWEFAHDHKAYYSVMMELDGMAFAERKPSQGAGRLMVTIAHALKTWVQSENLDEARLTMEWFEYILFLHGLVAASSVSFLSDSEKRLFFLLNLGVDDLLTAWSVRLRKG